MARRIRAFLAVGAGAAGFALLAQRIRVQRPPSWDHRLLSFLSPERQPAPARATFDAVNALVGEYRGLAFALALVVLLLARRRIREAVLTVTLIGAALATAVALKPAFSRPPLIAGRHDYFPSTHAAGSFALCAACAALTWPTRWRGPVLAASAAILVLYGGTLVYTRSHYPSDVLAGWSLALAWSGGFGLFMPTRQ